MSYILIIILITECILILKWGFIRRDRLIQFPVLAATVFLGWMIPQMLGVSIFTSLPPGALEKAVFMAILSLSACILGYNFNKRPARILNWKFNRKRLMVSSYILCLLGTIFIYLTNDLATEQAAELGGQWTGIITIYVFFTSMFTIGFALAFNLHLQKPSTATLIIIIYGILVFIQRIIIHGRRAAMLQLFFIILLSIYYNFRWSPPRLVIIMSILLGILAINGIGEYRGLMLADDSASWSGAGVSEVLNIDFVDNFKNIAKGESGVQEVLNATLTIEATQRNLQFDFGLSLWNSIVFNYVPAQIIGTDLKNMLMFNFENPAFTEFGHIPHTGSTFTGLSDAFQSFWYFGALIFFFIGLILSRWHRAAMNGSFSAQLIVITTMTAALHTITHTTHHFFIEFIKLILFLLPFLVISKLKDKKNYHEKS